MKKRKLTKRYISKENSVVKVEENKNEFGRSKRSIYMSGCFMAIVSISFSLLQSGKINEAILFVIGSFLVFPVLNELAKLIWNE